MYPFVRIGAFGISGGPNLQDLDPWPGTISLASPTESQLLILTQNIPSECLPFQVVKTLPGCQNPIELALPLDTLPPHAADRNRRLDARGRGRRRH